MAKNRRILLVDRRVQWALVRQLLLHWACFSLATMMLLALLQLLSGEGALKSWTEQWQAVRPMATAVLITSMLIFPMFIYDSLKLSNRFVGPLVRLRRTLRDLAEGRPYTPLVFRAHDFWAEMADDLDHAVARLNQHGEDPQFTAERHCETEDERESSVV